MSAQSDKDKDDKAGADEHSEESGRGSADEGVRASKRGKRRIIRHPNDALFDKEEDEEDRKQQAEDVEARRRELREAEEAENNQRKKKSRKKGTVTTQLAENAAGVETLQAADAARTPSTLLQTPVSGTAGAVSTPHTPWKPAASRDELRIETPVYQCAENGKRGEANNPRRKREAHKPNEATREAAAAVTQAAAAAAGTTAANTTVSVGRAARRLELEAAEKEASQAAA
ncbi:hypothetical protein B484DRAFT_472075, partial [Ochromonadaceae sp. CCMP2298]